MKDTFDSTTRRGTCAHCHKAIHYSANGSAWYHDDTRLRVCTVEPLFAEPTSTVATNDVPLAKRLHDLALETADDGLCNLLADAAAAVRERDAIINAWGVRYDWTPEGMKAAHAGDFVPWLHLWKAWDSAND